MIRAHAFAILRWARAHAAGLILLAGTLLRVLRYLANRSLWLDEAMLANSILTYSFRQLLTQPLLHWQAAPIGFVLLEKAAVVSLGESEYAMRLVPLIAGIGALWLFGAIAQTLLDPRGALAAIALFATTESLIYYSCEAKQYGVDVFVELSLLWLALKYLEMPGATRRLALLTIAGVLAIFLSHPAVFVLAAIGIALIFPRRAMPLLATMGVVWLSAFALNEWLFLKPLTPTGSLRQYWAFAFMPHASRAAIIWLGASLRDLYTNYADLWLPLPDIAILLSMVGLIGVFKRPALWQLLVLPIVFAIAAAAVGQFPFSGRLVLYTVPLLILLIGYGTQAMLALCGPGARCFTTVVLLLLLGPTLGRALVYGLVAPGREEIKPMLQRIARDARPGDTLFCPRLTQIPLHYYLDRFGTRAMAAPFSQMRLMAGKTDPSSDAEVAIDLEALKGRSRAWVLVTHPLGVPGFDLDEASARILSAWGKRQAEGHAKNASVYLYDLHPPD